MTQREWRITISMCSDVSDALIVLEQDFKPRNVKGALAVVAKFLRDRGSMNNTRQAAEELASSAIRMVRDSMTFFAAGSQTIADAGSAG